MARISPGHGSAPAVFLKAAYGMLDDSERQLEWAMRLVEQYAGIGSLRWREGTLGPIPYRIARYQGMATSGLPVPGVHRIEGVVTLDGIAEAAALVGADV